MSMIRTIALGATLLAPTLIGPSAACAQDNETPTALISHHLNWTFDPVHSTLTAAAASPVTYISESAHPNTAAETATVYTGRVNITVTIDLISPLPKGASIRCSGDAALQYQAEQKTGNSTLIEFATEQTAQSVDATVSGNTAKCQFGIPYSWTVPGAIAGETVTVQGVTAAVGIASVLQAPDGSVARTLRSSNQEVGASPKPPSDGSVTTFKASTVL